jgi:hypothetical protein
MSLAISLGPILGLILEMILGSTHPARGGEARPVETIGVPG